MMLMRIPNRYWDVSIDNVQLENEPARKVIVRYIENIEEMLDEGIGLILWGDNDTGKTSASVVIAKAARRTGAPVYFTTMEGLRQAVLNDAMFSSDTSVEARALNVELLVLDEFGKEHAGQTGFMNRYIENLMRDRCSRKLSTIITANPSPSALAKKYQESMMKVMAESMMPVAFTGASMRAAGMDRVTKLLVG